MGLLPGSEAWLITGEQQSRATGIACIGCASSWGARPAAGAAAGTVATGSGWRAGLGRGCGCGRRSFGRGWRPPWVLPAAAGMAADNREDHAGPKIPADTARPRCNRGGHNHNASRPVVRRGSWPSRLVRWCSARTSPIDPPTCCMVLTSAEATPESWR
jgi:hypothetical protein